MLIHLLAGKLKHDENRPFPLSFSDLVRLSLPVGSCCRRRLPLIEFQQFYPFWSIGLAVRLQGVVARESELLRFAEGPLGLPQGGFPCWGRKYRGPKPPAWAMDHEGMQRGERG